MNENILLVVDYDKICRLCLHTTGAMSDLFENNSEISLKDMVLRATDLSVEEHDGFPTKICHRCRYIVEMTCELRNMVEKTNTLLVNAGNHIETMEEEQEEIPEKQITLLSAVPKNYNEEDTIDLRLIMQDDGVMTLVKPDLGSPVYEKMVNIEEPSKGTRTDMEEEEIKIISKDRKVMPKQLTCQICLTAFSDPEDVRSHVGVHYIDSNLTPYTKLQQFQRPFKCETCRKTLSKPQLIRHHRTHLNVNPFVCKQDGCSFVGKNQDSLRRHLSTHSSRTQVCERCGAAYKRRSELELHMTRAHRPAPAHCRTCRKRFRNAVTLATHVRHYHKPRRYKCERSGCDKAYHTPASLAAHSRAHSDERLFSCHLCSAAAYTTQSLLNRHIRFHERSRLSKCDKCAETFDDYSAFYRHRISQHGRWLPHRCIGCSKRYHTESKLEQHLETCEQALQTLDYTAPADETTKHLMDNSIQEIINSEHNSLQLEGEVHEEITEELLDKFRGQSLLVQPGNISDLSKELELQEFPADGLLYIEVDSEAEDTTWQQFSEQND